MVTVFNLLVFKFISIAVSEILSKGYEQYTEFEENAKFAFDEIQEMLKQNNVDEAIKLIDKLKGKDDIKTQSNFEN